MGYNYINGYTWDTTILMVTHGIRLYQWLHMGYDYINGYTWDTTILMVTHGIRLY